MDSSNQSSQEASLEVIAVEINQIQQEDNGFLLQQIRAAEQISIRTQPAYQNHKNRLPKRYHRYLKKMKIGNTSQSCTICLSKYQQNEVVDKLPCGHIIHHRCCKQWFVVEHKCPVCRMNLKTYFQNLMDLQIVGKQQKTVHSNQ